MAKELGFELPINFDGFHFGPVENSARVRRRLQVDVEVVPELKFLFDVVDTIKIHDHAGYKWAFWIIIQGGSLETGNFLENLRGDCRLLDANTRQEILCEGVSGAFSVIGVKDLVRLGLGVDA